MLYLYHEREISVAITLFPPLVKDHKKDLSSISDLIKKQVSIKNYKNYLH